MPGCEHLYPSHLVEFLLSNFCQNLSHHLRKYRNNTYTVAVVGDELVNITFTLSKRKCFFFQLKDKIF